MSVLHAFALAILQGITELFPISSLGHTVIVPSLLGWPIDQHAPEFLPFVVVLHVGTAVALLLYFWREWLAILLGIFGRGPAAGDAWRALWLIVIATLPAVVVGFLFEKLVRGLFASPLIAAAFLVANGFLLLLGDYLRFRARPGQGRQPPNALDWKGALAIGFWQCLAFIPGISRSGAAMVGGLVAGLQHAEAAHFSFLIATPIIAGAAVLEVPKLWALPGHGISGLAVASGVVAGVAAYLSIAFLMRYFRRRDFDDALVPFAIYCWVAGVGSALLFIFRTGG
ncbi:MAG TPA: undecaprenyl-diphosphate phosphatase [Stellaceae bacterium]|jgi:undecaprenyl-diphosphatase|nr:undecaprenyl-diphosphate phosphatase [Stellaceae bacterium]